MRIIAPGHRCRSLKIKLRGDIVGERTVRQLILRRIIEIAVIQRDEIWAERIALVHSEVRRLIAVKVRRGKILAADVVRP